jgi:hypothetical protein
MQAPPHPHPPEPTSPGLELARPTEATTEMSRRTLKPSQAGQAGIVAAEAWRRSNRFPQVAQANS